MAKKKKKPKINTKGPIQPRGDNPGILEQIAAKGANKVFGIRRKMSPSQRKKKTEMLSRRVELSKLITQHGYDDRTCAKILEVSPATIKTDREWLYEMWMTETLDNVDKAKQQLIKRKQFVLDEARREWERSKGNLKTTKKKDKVVKGGANKGGSTKEKENTETVREHLGDSQFLKLFDEVADDIAELQGVKKDQVVNPINIIMPSLPADFKEFGIPVDGDNDDKIDKAEEAEFSEVASLDEEEVRNKRK